jgi:hypothetical protein
VSVTLVTDTPGRRLKIGRKAATALHRPAVLQKCSKSGVSHFGAVNIFHVRTQKCQSPYGIWCLTPQEEGLKLAAKQPTPSTAPAGKGARYAWRPFILLIL